MGNCLDIPPPPAKSHKIYLNGVRCYVVRRKMPYTYGSLTLMPNDYRDYQRRAAVGRVRPVIFNPYSGYTYPYPLESPVFRPVYYPDYDYVTDSHYGYTGNTEQRFSGHQKNKKTRGKSHMKNGTSKPDPDICLLSETDESRCISPAKIVDDKIKVETPILPSSTTMQREGAQDDAYPLERTASLVAATSINVVRSMSSKSTMFEPIKEEVLSITTDFTSEQALSETEVTYEEQRVDVLNNTSTTAEDSIQEHPGEPNKQSTVADDAPRTFAGSNWANSPEHDDSHSDVVLSYHSADADVMRKIKHKLQAAGVRTVVSYPTDGSKQDVLTAWLMFPQAVADAKVMIVLMSQNSVIDRHIKDEVCLAQVTQTLIYPVALEKSQDLLTTMDAGLKLQVACYKWTQLGGEVNPDLALSFMVRRVKEDLACISSSDDNDVNKKVCFETSEQAEKRRGLFCHLQTQKMIPFGGHVTAAQYWDKCYGSDVGSVSWERFHEDLFKEYRYQIKGTIDGSFSHHFKDCLKREIEVGKDETVCKKQLVNFCNKLDTDQDVWERVYCVAREAQAFKEILSVESTVRAVAIENIGKFGNKNADVALMELISDNNPNIRAAVTLSLSRSMSVGDEVTLNAIMATLDDKDELVRETGCLTLGRLRAHKATEKLVKLCKNDVIASVRDAAAVALREIRGD